MLIQQFFTSLADRLSATARTPAVTARGKIVLLPALPQPTLLRTAVRRLGLGAGDPVAEAQWADRIKRGGIVLGLLLLVWIGSRIVPKSMEFSDTVLMELPAGLHDKQQ